MNSRLEIIDNCCNLALLPCLLALSIGANLLSPLWLHSGTVALALVCVTKYLVWLFQDW